jgi:hypothetical protein
MGGEEFGREFLDPLFGPNLNAFLIPAGAAGRVLVRPQLDVRRLPT